MGIGISQQPMPEHPLLPGMLVTDPVHLSLMGQYEEQPVI
jgi:hypothetical protein